MAYRGFWNRWILWYLPPQLLMTIPRFYKPLNTVIFITTVTDGYTAVLETAEYRGIYYRNK